MRRLSGKQRWGAHPVSDHRINDHFWIAVPFARAINPITKTNWEGTGVEPDVKVPARQALHVAQLQALEKLRAEETDPLIQYDLDAAINAIGRNFSVNSSDTTLGLYPEAVEILLDLGDAIRNAPSWGKRR